MPIITIQFIEDVVATPEQKRELIVEMTNTFVGILGDVVRPFVYTLIKETPQGEWGIAGVPMPDLVYLTGEEHAGVIGRSNDMMRGAIAQMAAAAADDSQPANDQADSVWRGAADAVAASNGSAVSQSSNDQADSVWRGTAKAVASSNGTASAASSNGTATEHRQLFERWFEELWNKKNYDIAYELVDPDFTAHGAGGQDIKQGPDGVIGMVKAWHAAMPDGRMTIDDIITEGTLSTIRMTWEATHTGQFGEIPASGSRIKVTSTGIDRVIDGKITEGWGELDMLGMLQQMGAIPSPDAEAPPAAASAPLTAEDRKAIIFRLYEETNKGNFDYLYEVLADDFLSHGGGGLPDTIGPKGLIDLVDTFMAALPDLQFEVLQLVASDDNMVVARGLQTATHKGNFMGMAPATGNKVEWAGTATFRFNDDGKIAERWVDMDSLTLFQQLGIVPAFDAAGG